MKIKPVYLVWDDESKRYIHNTTRNIGIYSSKAEEFFSRADLDTAYEAGCVDGYMNGNKDWYDSNIHIHGTVERLIEHDGKPYKEIE